MGDSEADATRYGPLDDDIIDRLRKISPREVCEHGSQRVKCPICELADAEAEIERLRMVLGEIAHHPTGGVGCNPVNFVKLARDALGQEQEG